MYDLTVTQVRAAARDCWLAGIQAETAINMLSADFTPAWMVTIAFDEYNRLTERYNAAPALVRGKGDPQP